MKSDEPQSIIIRKAELTEAKVVAAITEAAYTKYVSFLGRQPQPMTADYHQMISEHQVWLLCRGNQAAGVLVLMHEQNHLFIYNVAISPQYQKQGLGRQLLVWAEKEANRSGYKEIHLYTNALFEENIRLYERLGYVETAREPFMSSTLVYMVKWLKNEIGQG